MADEWRSGRRFNRRVVFRFGDCTPDGRASIYSVMKTFSEIAGDDYEHRGLGHRVLFDNGQAFLVAKNSISIKSMPEYGRELVVSTWERCVKGVFFIRDFELLDADEKVMVSGTSSWFLVNPNSREVLRPDALCGPLPEPAEETADCPACPKLRFPEGERTVLGERPVYYSDLDANGHVNNAVYSRIATDFMPGEYRGRNVKEYYITFKKETRSDEALTITGMADKDSYIVEGSTNGEQHFISKIVF